jgi:hypothetical protein
VGCAQIRTDAAQQHFTEAIYYLTKSVDPMRPVIVNDGGEHTVSDIITLHDYQELQPCLKRIGTRIDEILDNQTPHNNHRLPLPKAMNTAVSQY